MRIPSKSYLLSALSLFGLTHYIDISHKLNSITIVGPVEAIDALINASNQVSTSNVTPEQRAGLQRACGIGDSFTRADEICVSLEKRIQRIILSVFVIAGLISWGPRLADTNTRLIYIMIGILTCVCVCLATGGWSVRQHTATQQLQAPADLTESLIDVPDTTVSTVTEEEPSPESGNIVTIIWPQSYFFEVVHQGTFPQLSTDEALLHFTDTARAYAVALLPNLTRYLAEMTYVPPDASLHVCHYDPMIDPNLLQLRNNFQKGVQRDNKLMIVLPALESFDDALMNPTRGRARTESSTQFVTTYADLESMLVTITAGVMPELIFVLPYDRTQTWNDRRETWKSFRRILGSENCMAPQLDTDT
jgi:hypothetical protein